MEAALRDELRIALRRRGLPTRGLKEDLIKRLLRGPGAQALTEEAAGALLFVRRRLGSRAGGLALTDDAGAIGWIVEACKEKSVHNGGRRAISDLRRDAGHQAERPWMRRSGNSQGARSCLLRASVRGRSSPVTERSFCGPSGRRRAEKLSLCDLRLTARFEWW